MPVAATQALNLRAIDRRLYRTLVALDAANRLSGGDTSSGCPPVHNIGASTRKPGIGHRTAPHRPHESKQHPNEESGANRVIAGHTERVATKSVVPCPGHWRTCPFRGPMT
jgi:hypothetical protein